MSWSSFVEAKIIIKTSDILINLTFGIFIYCCTFRMEYFQDILTLMYKFKFVLIKLIND